MLNFSSRFFFATEYINGQHFFFRIPELGKVMTQEANKKVLTSYH